eukprot:6128070-Amphidinium_carterae.1
MMNGGVAVTKAWIWLWIHTLKFLRIRWWHAMNAIVSAVHRCLLGSASAAKTGDVWNILLHQLACPS